MLVSLQPSQQLYLHIHSRTRVQEYKPSSPSCLGGRSPSTGRARGRSQLTASCALALLPRGQREALAELEGTVANIGQRKRECEGSETTTLPERTVSDCVHSWRYYHGGDIRRLPHYANNGVTLNVQLRRHRVIWRLARAPTG